MNNYWIDYVPQYVAGCLHGHPACTCTLLINGKNECAGFTATVPLISTSAKEEAIRDTIARFSAQWQFDGVSVVPGSGDIEVLRFMVEIRPDDNIKLVPAPNVAVGFPQSLMAIGPDPRIIDIYRRADMGYLSHLMNYHRSPDIPADVLWFEREIWSTDFFFLDEYGHYCPIRLSSYIFRKLSLYNCTFGKINGKPTCVPSMADLFPDKFAKTVLKQRRPVHKRLPGSEPAWACLDEAFRYMYHHFGTSHLLGRQHIPFTTEDLEGMPLGTSAGLNKAEPNHKKHRPPIVQVGDATIKISTSGKKYENLPTDLRSLLKWLKDPDAPDLSILWNIVPKNENFIEFIKQLSQPEWDMLLQKLRIYVIPSSIFILMERLVSRVRFRLERGKVIQVGHGHSKGGADRIANRLKINMLNELKAILVEGDVRNFDQSVAEEFVDLYYSHGMAYDVPGTPNYAVRLRITKFLIRAIICRLTHLFGTVWGIQTGGVPSGVLNTSHMDSWVMALWFFLFGVYTIKTAPPEHQEKLELALVDLIALIVYGDDHVWNKTGDPLVSSYFSGHAFAKFMSTFFGVEIRGIKDGVTFLTDTYLGMIIRMGVTFLRHQFVLNPFGPGGPTPEPGQCRYLPFRESREYFARVAWGKENRVRDQFDIILSCLGHAYGTYGSNVPAWYGLKMIYLEAIDSLGLLEVDVLEKVVKITTESDLRELRRKGVSREEILSGFPTLETLKKKNLYDENYHERIFADESVADFI